MKNLLLSTIALLIFVNVNAQISFQKTIGNNVQSEISFFALELPSGSFIITNMVKDVTTNVGKPYVIKLSKYGDIMEENFISNSSVSYAHTAVLEFNSKILLLGLMRDTQNDYQDSIVITHIDTNLQIVSDTKISFMDSLDFGISAFANVNDSIILLKFRTQYTCKTRKQTGIVNIQKNIVFIYI